MDRKPIIITIRYSVLQNSQAGWEIGKKNTLDDYRAKLFDDKRLATRFHLLKTVAMPSFHGQTDPEHLHVVLITSTELPAQHLDALNEYASRFPNVRVALNPPEAGIDHRKPLEDILREHDYSLYAHVRNDDDDALASDYAARLRRYMRDENIGMGVSFGQGYGGLYDEDAGEFRQFRHLYYPKVSCGLAVINKFNPASGRYASSFRTAYELGSHTRADQKAPVILDSVAPAFLYSIYQGQDTANDMLRHTKDPAEAEKVFQSFSLGGGSATQAA